MKQSLLLFILFISLKCFSQQTEEWKQYLKDSVYNSDGPEYIYLYTTQGGKFLKHLNYNTKKGRNVLSINFGDSLVVFKSIINHDLFGIVKENFKDIKKVKDYLNTERAAISFRDNFSDTSKPVVQLGIRYKDLHYNHFTKFSFSEIEKQKNDKRKAGMLVINKLHSILEIAEQNK